jgi:hypothetical protein
MQPARWSAEASATGFSLRAATLAFILCWYWIAVSALVFLPLLSIFTSNPIDRQNE